jgi:hypothetical protein
MDISPAQARIVDPVLTNHATGFRQPGLIADVLFPYVTVATRAAKRIVFGKQAMQLAESLRAPGTEIKRVAFGYAAEPVSLIQHALAAVVPIEHEQEAREVPGLDLQMRAVALVAAKIELAREAEAAALARNAASYAASNKLAYTSGTSWWNASSKPKQDFEAGKEAVRARTGMRPNTAVLTATARAALSVHEDVLSYRKAIGRFAVDDDVLKAYLGVARLEIADAIVADADGSFTDVWGDDAILAYVPESETAQQMEMPSYGYTYRLRGHPVVNPTRWDPNTRSWVNDYVSEQRPYIVGPDSGFLFQNAGLKA